MIIPELTLFLERILYELWSDTGNYPPEPFVNTEDNVTRFWIINALIYKAGEPIIQRLAITLVSLNFLCTCKFTVFRLTLD